MHEPKHVSAGLAHSCHLGQDGKVVNHKGYLVPLLFGQVLCVPRILKPVISVRFYSFVFLSASPVPSSSALPHPPTSSPLSDSQHHEPPWQPEEPQTPPLPSITPRSQAMPSTHEGRKCFEICMRQRLGRLERAIFVSHHSFV